MEAIDEVLSYQGKDRTKILNIQELSNSEYTYFEFHEANGANSNFFLKARTHRLITLKERHLVPFASCE